MHFSFPCDKLIDLYYKLAYMYTNKFCLSLVHTES